MRRACSLCTLIRCLLHLLVKVASPKARATYSWTIGTSTKRSLDLVDVSPDTIVHEDAYEVPVLLNSTGAYSLVVTESVGGVTTRTLSLNLYCKYVRREIRDLTLEDRHAYLHAAKTVWTTSTREGRLKKGEIKERSLSEQDFLNHCLFG